MNIQTSKGMGIRTQKGMGISNSKGMGLAHEKNYFTFNEYERQRRYLFGDRGKGNNKKKPPPKPVKKPPAVEEKPKEEKPPKEKTPEPKTEEEPPKEEEPKKETILKPAATVALAIDNLKSENGDLPTTRLPPMEEVPKLHGNSLRSMQRMLNLFG